MRVSSVGSTPTVIKMDDQVLSLPVDVRPLPTSKVANAPPSAKISVTESSSSLSCLAGICDACGTSKGLSDLGSEATALEEQTRRYSSKPKVRVRFSKLDNDGASGLANVSTNNVIQADKAKSTSKDTKARWGHRDRGDDDHHKDLERSFQKRWKICCCRCCCCGRHRFCCVGQDESPRLSEARARDRDLNAAVSKPGAAPKNGLSSNDRPAPSEDKETLGSPLKILTPNIGAKARARPEVQEAVKDVEVLRGPLRIFGVTSGPRERTLLSRGPTSGPTSRGLSKVSSKGPRGLKVDADEDDHQVFVDDDVNLEHRNNLLSVLVAIMYVMMGVVFSMVFLN